jgi:hypothetical protein
MHPILQPNPFLEESEMNKSVLLLTTLLSGLAASTAGASIVVSASPTDVGGGLTQYLLNFASTGAGAKPIAAFDIEFAAATMSQQNAGGALDTTFQNNNGVIPALGGSVAKDSQFLFNTSQLTLVNGTRGNGHGFNSEGSTFLSGIFGFVPASGGGPGNIPVGAAGRDIAQIVIPTGQSATYSGQISFDDGSFVNVGGAIPAPEPNAVGFLSVSLAGLGLNLRRRRDNAHGSRRATRLAGPLAGRVV